MKLIHCTEVTRLQSSVLLLSLEALFVPSLFSFLRSTADNKQCFVLLKVSDVVENVNINIMKLLQTQFMWISWNYFSQKIALKILSIEISIQSLSTH